MLHDGLILSPFNAALPCLLASLDKTLRRSSEEKKKNECQQWKYLKESRGHVAKLANCVVQKAPVKGRPKSFCPCLQDEWAELPPVKDTVSQTIDHGSSKIYLTVTSVEYFFSHVPGDLFFRFFYFLKKALHQQTLQGTLIWAEYVDCRLMCSRAAEAAAQGIT